jgi:hypothetical protein
MAVIENPLCKAKPIGLLGRLADHGKLISPMPSWKGMFETLRRLFFLP